MKLSLAARSMALFGLCVIVLVATTMGESAFGVMSLMTQRIITLLGFVLPSVAGIILGIISLVRKEGRLWLALAGIVLNGLFALFHIAIVLFAG